MLKNAISQINKLKMRNEIIDIFGDGEKTSYFKSLEWDLIYCLGPERSYLGVDREWLLIWFDDRGQLKEFRIMTD